jgi:hypothetical protein
MYIFPVYVYAINVYSNFQRAQGLDETCADVLSREMFLSSYLSRSGQTHTFRINSIAVQWRLTCLTLAEIQAPCSPQRLFVNVLIVEALVLW